MADDRKAKMVEVRDRADDELHGSLERARDELFRLKLGRFTNQIENVMQIRVMRREIARIMTVINERKHGIRSDSASSGGSSSRGSGSQTGRSQSAGGAVAAGAEE